jgi:hypothetical protein
VSFAIVVFSAILERVWKPTTETWGVQGFRGWRWRWRGSFRCEFLCLMGEHNTT